MSRLTRLRVLGTEIQWQNSLHRPLRRSPSACSGSAKPVWNKMGKTAYFNNNETLFQYLYKSILFMKCLNINNLDYCNQFFIASFVILQHIFYLYILDWFLSLVTGYSRLNLLNKRKRRKIPVRLTKEKLRAEYVAKRPTKPSQR